MDIGLRNSTFKIDLFVLFFSMFVRIVVHGKSFLKAIAPYSAQVYNVNTELRLTKSRVGHIVCVCVSKIVLTLL